MNNVVRIEYLAGFNRFYTDEPKAHQFLILRGQVAINRLLRAVIKEVYPEGGWGDVTLQACLGSPRAVSLFSEFASAPLTVLAFPKENIQVERYELNPEEELMSNIHRNLDPLSITNIRSGFHLSPKRTDDYVDLNMRRSAPNRISGAILFRQNPIKNPQLYDGFQDFLDYHPDYRKNKAEPMPRRD